MSKHTPGPWYVEMGNDCRLVVDAQECVVAIVKSPDVDPDEWETANAKLIAAAPDLLEACKQAARYIHVCGPKPLHVTDTLVHDALAAAIAKAKGG